MRTAFFILAVLPLIPGTACSTGKTGGNQPAPARILEASVARTIPGRPEGKIEQVYTLNLKWNSADRPEAFFLHTGTYWREGSIQWIGRPGLQGRQYPGEPGGPEVQRGDTLAVQTVRPADKPAAIRSVRPNDTALFIKTNNSQWHRVTIGSISRKPDTEMP